MVRVRRWCATVERRAANRNTSAGLLTRHSREDPAPPVYPEERARQRSCVRDLERSSLRGLGRTDCAFRVRRSWLASKKVARLPPLSETLRAPDPADPASMKLELDES